MKVPIQNTIATGRIQVVSAVEWPYGADDGEDDEGPGLPVDEPEQPFRIDIKAAFSALSTLSE
jgi:hypothetical protein